MISKTKFTASYLILLFLVQSTVLALERRTEQFPKDFGYVFLPIPYSLPGAGSGFGLLGGFNNIPFGSTETTTDLFLVGISGDISGVIAGFTDIPIWPETLLLDYFTLNFNKGSFRTYRNRKMDSDPDNYLVSELSDTSLLGGRIILTLFDRMFEIFTIQYDIKNTLSAIRDNEGKLLYETDQKVDFTSKSYGSQIDWTDDRIDPLKGARLIYTYADSPSASDDSPDYFVQTYNFTGYIPVGISTFAVNWFRSGTTVRKEGNTDLTYLISKEKLLCLTNCDDETINVLAKNQQATNRYGSAGSLGGSGRLRSYAGGRYSGAQVGFRAVEFRWNLTDKKTPFDFYFVSDVRTGFQIALFFEEGSVADVESELWNIKRTSTGIGTRLLTSSGFVYRLDVATGQEGREFSLIFDYPWGAIGR